jgi:DNA-binding transcriptional LysR family regulator
MLNLERLRVLRSVAEYGSVQAAATALHVSASAVSQQIAKLEREIRHPLLEPNGRGVRLTDIALHLSTRTADVMASMEKLEAELDGFRNEVAGPVRLSAFPTAARGVLPALLALLRSQHPALQPTLVEQEPTESLPLLMRGDVDMVIAQDWFNAPLVLPEGLERVDLFDDVADIALPADHRLARKRSVGLKDLVHESWITWQPGSICHEWLLHTFRTMGHEPLIAHTAAEQATQLALVAAGLGPAVMPRLGRGEVPTGVAIVSVTPTLHRHVFAAWRSNTPRSTNVVAVRNALVGLTKQPQRSESRSQRVRLR